MYRLYDVECSDCLCRYERLVDVPGGGTPPRTFEAQCDVCEEVSEHEVMLSCPAPYMGESVYNPHVRGGDFDTLGNAPVPELPDLPKGVDSNSDNYKQLWSTPEWKEARAEIKEVNRCNAHKRKRAAALHRGENINMRRDKCAGDPKITA